ncbi:MAG: SUMF1/EgtB/PvdO family nonheme iron enzyme, partial [Myxococcota bacterium]
MLRPSVSAVIGVLLFTACSGEKTSPDKATDKPKKAASEEGDGKPGPKASGALEAPSAKPQPTAAADDGAKPKQGEYGPTVTIPAGTLKAGSRCQDVPRDRRHELEHESIAMASFEMDAYPYPNREGETVKLGVTWSEAKALCEERGKRLCTETEWEWACKAEKNETYPWGRGFKKEPCPGQLDGKLGARPGCKTDFGVKDMIGVALEWTASDWKRGTPTGDKVVRGAREKMVSWLSARCTHSRKRDPQKSYENVGFRCCSGPVNASEVVVAQNREVTLKAYPDIDDKFQRA